MFEPLLQFRAGWPALGAVLLISVVAVAQEVLPSVVPVLETQAVPNSGDAADDPCIWVHPRDAALSLIVGTDKQGGLAVYDLSGKQLQYLPVGQPNNVDVRYAFPLSTGAVDIVVCNERKANTFLVFGVDAASRELRDVGARPFVSEIETYGFCLYRSEATSTYYAIVTSKSGDVGQWELIATQDGKIDAVKRRTFHVGTQLEGCVADDERGALFIGEEAVGVWKYGAEPDSDAAQRMLIDRTGPEGHLTADVEGMAIYREENGAGYLLVSSQGSDSYAVYERGGAHAYVGSLVVGAGAGIDAVTGTDGIDVTSRALGAAFPKGAFVAQDDVNDGANQNFKVAPWESVEKALKTMKK
ncbi:MAG: phytase [Candidatus Hydrogenedentes bacterium]|nr:phytase [Candidatus Hydrogenedentota bacterium]